MNVFLWPQYQQKVFCPVSQTQEQHYYSIFAALDNRNNFIRYHISVTSWVATTQRPLFSRFCFFCLLFNSLSMEHKVPYLKQ